MSTTLQRLTTTMPSCPEALWYWRLLPDLRASQIKSDQFEAKHVSLRAVFEVADRHWVMQMIIK